MRIVASQRGFTLIELLVVIAIIGLLASIVLASLNSARAKARDATRASTMHQFQTALELYNSSNGHYPVTNSNWRSQCAGWGSYAANSVIPGLVPAYLPSMPADPAMNATANANCYLYITWVPSGTDNGTDYKLLDYNIIDSAGPGSVPALVDLNRNYGTPWANNALCPATTDGVWSWAIWSSPTSACW